MPCSHKKELQLEAKKRKKMQECERKQEELRVEYQEKHEQLPESKIKMKRNK